MSRMCCRSFRKPLVTMSRKMQIVSCVTASNTYRSKPFHKTFEQKRAPGGCSFLRVRLAFPWSAPRGTYLSKMNDIAGPQWQLGGRRVRLWRSAETGEGAPSVRRNIYLLPFSCRISRVLENWRSEFPNFLHAAPYWNSKDTLLPRFAKILLCVDL